MKLPVKPFILILRFRKKNCKQIEHPYLKYITEDFSIISIYEKEVFLSCLNNLTLLIGVKNKNKK